jgi:hypothetical protein
MKFFRYERRVVRQFEAFQSNFSVGVIYYALMGVFSLFRYR